MMHHVPQAGLTVLAVAGPVERVVRRHLREGLMFRTFSNSRPNERGPNACMR
jgi:hypothetical protein